MDLGTIGRVSEEASGGKVSKFHLSSLTKDEMEPSMELAATIKTN